jgi:hypothetical protein
MLRLGIDTKSCSSTAADWGHPYLQPDAEVAGMLRYHFQSAPTGGGLRRSVGGWRELRSARDAGMFFESDERILGDSDFVGSALQLAEDDFEKRTLDTTERMWMSRD